VSPALRAVILSNEQRAYSGAQPHDELDGRAQIADRLDDEVTWLRTCTGWIAQVDAGGYPPALHVAVNLVRVRR
jgi:hypothetical protein